MAEVEQSKNVNLYGVEFLSLPPLYRYQREVKPSIRAVRGSEHAGCTRGSVYLLEALAVMQFGLQASFR